MPPSSLEPPHRAAQLRERLQPDRLLADLQAESAPLRPYLWLTGIKGAMSEYDECVATYFPAFERELLSDPAVEALLAPYRALGFRFGWEGYCDPSGVEHYLTIYRDPQAEERLRQAIAAGTIAWPPAG